MSDFLQFSVLPAAHTWPVDPAAYPYVLEQLTEAPAWERECSDKHSMGLHGPAWGVLCRTSFAALTPDECCILQPRILMMFRGATAKACAARLSPLPASAIADIDRLVAENSPWSREVIVRDARSTRNAIARWLRRLPAGRIGVVRRYDWGKY